MLQPTTPDLCRSRQYGLPPRPITGNRRLQRHPQHRLNWCAPTRLTALLGTEAIRRPRAFRRRYTEPDAAAMRRSSLQNGHTSDQRRSLARIATWCGRDADRPVNWLQTCRDVLRRRRHLPGLARAERMLATQPRLFWAPLYQAPASARTRPPPDSARHVTARRDPTGNHNGVQRQRRDRPHVGINGQIARRAGVV